MDQLPEDAPQPRLCHLTKWPDFDGFGFNLQLGQFIGKVDDDSPAQHAQLREGDRIIEVNGVNIANENHRQVVERIKAIPNETRLLVLDRAGDRYYRERNLHVHGAQSNVLHCRTPNPRPAAVTTELIVSTHDDPMIVPNEHVVPLDTKQVQLHVPEVHVPNDKEETQIQNLANQQVTQVIVEATSRMQQNSTRPYDESHVQVNSKSSLELPIDNQQTIQALNDAGEQLHSLKLTTPAIDEKRSQNDEPNDNDQTRSSIESKSSSNSNANGGAAIKYHHNFIVTNSEEQFANERAQQEQQLAKQQISPNHNSNNGLTKVDATENTDRHRQHSRTNGSTGSQISQGSGQSQLSEGSSTTNNNDSCTLDLNLNMSASEMRKMLSQRKNRKIEAKKAQLDLRQKYEIIQQM